MDLQEYLKRLEQLPDRVEEAAIESVIIPAANDMLASIINRNVNEGKNSDGSVRRGYSTQPIYAGRERFVRGSGFNPVGKNGGKPRKTMYLPAGYKQLREVQGMRSDIKNYEYSGQTMLSFALEPVSNGAVLGFTNEKASKIRKGQEAKNGAAFPPTEEEKQAYLTEVSQGLGELQTKVLLNVS